MNLWAAGDDAGARAHRALRRERVAASRLAVTGARPASSWVRSRREAFSAILARALATTGSTVGPSVARPSSRTCERLAERAGLI